MRSIYENVLISVDDEFESVGIDVDGDSSRTWLYTMLEESCLIPLLEKYLSNESLVDMERHAELYYVCCQVNKYQYNLNGTDWN